MLENVEDRLAQALGTRTGGARIRRCEHAALEPAADDPHRSGLSRRSPGTPPGPGAAPCPAGGRRVPGDSFPPKDRLPPNLPPRSPWPRSPCERPDLSSRGAPREDAGRREPTHPRAPRRRPVAKALRAGAVRPSRSASPGRPSRVSRRGPRGLNSGRAAPRPSHSARGGRSRPSPSRDVSCRTNPAAVGRSAIFALRFEPPRAPLSPLRPSVFARFARFVRDFGGALARFLCRRRNPLDGDRPSLAVLGCAPSDALARAAASAAISARERRDVFAAALRHGGRGRAGVRRSVLFEPPPAFLVAAAPGAGPLAIRTLPLAFPLFARFSDGAAGGARSMIGASKSSARLPWRASRQAGRASTRVRTSATSPSARSPSSNGPKEMRISRLTASPRCSSTFLISRFLPSRRPMVIQAFEPCSRSSCASMPA